MKALFQAQLYQLRKLGQVKIMFFGVFGLNIIILAIMLMDNQEGFSSLSEVLAREPESWIMIFVWTLMLLFLLVSSICIGDYEDKSVNYEILNGHSRKEIFFGKILTSLILGELSAVLCIGGPLLILSTVKGFGHVIEMEGWAVRAILVMLIFARIICEIGVLSFFVKKQLLCATIVTLVLMGEMFFSNLQEYWLGGVTNYLKLSNMISFVSGTLDGKRVYIYENMPEGSVIVGTIVSTLIFSAVVLAIGYEFFRKDDMR